MRAEFKAGRLEAETLVNFVRIGWGRKNPAFCQFFTNLFIPGGTAEQHRWWGDLERLTAAPDVAARLLWEMQGIDVTDQARQLRVPTLIPDARFVPLDSANHVLLPANPPGPSCTRKSRGSWAVTGHPRHCAALP